jgi:hypothetical protein
MKRGYVMADLNGQKNDVVADGGIKCSIPGIRSLFASCADNSPKPETNAKPEVAAPNAAVKQMVNDGGLGDGMAAGAAKALGGREAQLANQMAKMGI